MKNIYVILWVINSVIGTGLLSNELQEDENFSSTNHNEYFISSPTGEKVEHYKAFFDFDFDYFLSVTEKSIQPLYAEHIIKIYSLVFTPQTSIFPLLYDLPPPDSLV
jgi:hypothetical protein